MPIQIIRSGTKQTVKIQTPIARILNAIRPVQPMKGTKNGPHLQQNLPKSMNKPK